MGDKGHRSPGMLAAIRKYQLSLTLAHRILTQLDEQTRDAILGNVGTMIVFSARVDRCGNLGKGVPVGAYGLRLDQATQLPRVCEIDDRRNSVEAVQCVHIGTHCDTHSQSPKPGISRYLVDKPDTLLINSAHT